jgi:hypothetical protein
MFEDILIDDPEPFDKFGPSYLFIQYFKDGEMREYEVSVNSQELLGALPLFPPKNINKERLGEFIEFIKAHLLLEKCLLLESNVV